MAGTELKPCPFCGGEAECHAWWSAIISGKYATFCTECGSGTDYFGTEAEAIEAWNTRVDFVTCKCGEEIEAFGRVQTCPSCGRKVMA